MDRDRLVERLLATFVVELDDHVGAMQRELLALERASVGPERADREDEAEAEARAALVTELLRRAHSLKGAARAVGLRPIEAVCHRLEELMGRERDGARVLAGEVLELVVETVDALAEASARVRAKQDLSGGPLGALVARLDAVVARPAAARLPVPPGSAARPDPSVVAGAAVRSDSPRPSLKPPDEAPGAEGGGTVRVAADKLDRVLARSGELLLARRRLEGHYAELEVLVDRARDWDHAWRRVARPLAAMAEAATAPARGPRSGRGRARLLAKRAAELLRRAPAHQRDVVRELERLRRGLAASHQRLDRAARDLEEEVRRARMSPLDEVCLGLERAVRDLARTGGKSAELVVEGGTVELDRSVLEALRAPLLHLVRNAVDHGLEAPAARRAAGKPETGRVVVSAALRAGLVELSVRDDGRGIDVASLRELARRRRLPVPATDEEAARLVFTHGLSTSPSVTEISGRGVGLDVVKSQVEAIHGAVEVSSSPGRGTTFVLRVPLTVITTRAVLVVVASQPYAIPAAAVVGVVRARAEELPVVDGQLVLPHRGALVPVRSLGQALGLRGVDPPRPDGQRLLVVLSAGTYRVALSVDGLLAEEEIVAKSLGPRLAGLSALAGATTLADGRLALILSPSEVLRGALEGPRPAAVGPARAGAAERRRILLADDSLTTRTLEQSILESAGYEVLVASDGAAAWELLQDEAVSLVVADVEMPRMDGFQLVQAIRSSKRFRSLPVVLVTGLERESDKRRGLELGADAYLVKSGFEREGLLAAVAHLV